MAKFSRVEVINETLRSGVVPVFYHPDLEVAAVGELDQARNQDQPGGKQ
jgi:hypothetical protein